MDKPIIFHSVNLIIEICRRKGEEAILDALNDLFCSIANLLTEEEMEFVINEAASFLKRVEPELAEWWQEEVVEEFEGFIEPNEDGSYSLHDAFEDDLLFISEEEERELQDQTRSQLTEMGEQIAYLPCYQENEDEETMYANISDIIHVLLDEGLTDYTLGKNSIYVGPDSMSFLQSYYDIDKYNIQFIDNIHVK